VFLGLGIANYFQGKYDESATALLRADELSNGSTEAIEYLGKTQMQRIAGPLPAAVDRICSRADRKPQDAKSFAWCTNLRFRQAYLSGNQSAAPQLLPHLREAVRLLPRDPVSTCTLGKALAWEKNWTESRSWMEKCVELEPDSTENHYRLSRIYAELGLADLSQKESTATLQLRTAQAQREQTTETFVYQILKSGEQASPK
jgi:tetratricopeptide (TPR) repeat protein